MKNKVLKPLLPHNLFSITEAALRQVYPVEFAGRIVRG